MTFTVTKSNVRKIKQGDPNFVIHDGLVQTGRAGFEISTDCPYNHLQILQTCIERGWLKPVAYVKDKELFWEEFEK